MNQKLAAASFQSLVLALFVFFLSNCSGIEGQIPLSLQDLNSPEADSPGDSPTPGDDGTVPTDPGTDNPPTQDPPANPPGSDDPPKNDNPPDDPPGKDNPPPPSTGGINLPPSGIISWDWQIGVNTERDIIVPPGVTMMDIDGFNTSAATVARLKSMDIYTVCYINAGSWEEYRPDANQYPDYLKLHYDKDWDEWFLDVRDVFKPNSVLARILRQRFQMCKDKGFDAIEPDNLQADENAGGKITLQEQIDFNGFIADLAHEIGIAIFQKNGPDKVLKKDRTGKMMVEKFDGIINEECQQYSECTPLNEYVKRGKPALNVEYEVQPNCNLTKNLGINTMRRDLYLVGPQMKRYNRVTCP